MTPNPEGIDTIVSRLRGASRLLFVTGAGISADAGLPTYRGVGGIYGGKPTEDGVTIEDALSGEMLRQHPEICWKYIRQIEEAGRGASPSAGHRAIAGLERCMDEVWVLTQNVDGLHRVAGSSRVIDIHGDIHDLRCTECEFTTTVPNYKAVEPVPVCPLCGALVRPEVVLFGERLPPEKLYRLERELMRGFDAVFSVGTSAVFPYIAEPILRARQAGKLTVEIDPGETRVSEWVDVKLHSRAARVLPTLLQRLLE